MNSTTMHPSDQNSDGFFIKATPAELGGSTTRIHAAPRAGTN
jgi:hypothetical protein